MATKPMLEDVKIGDRVWLGQYSHRPPVGWRKINLDEVIAVTATRFRVKRHPKDLYRKSDGADYKGTTYRYFRIATNAEIEAWEAEQAKAKADAETAEAERQREREAKCERARRLFQAISVDRIETPVGIDGDVVTIEFEGHRYEIREVQ